MIGLRVPDRSSSNTNEYDKTEFHNKNPNQLQHIGFDNLGEGTMLYT